MKQVKHNQETKQMMVKISTVGLTALALLALLPAGFARQVGPVFVMRNDGPASAGTSADLVSDVDCGTAKGCFRQPEGCEVDKCKFFVSWTGQKDWVDFELVGDLPDDSKWVSLCFAKDKAMGNSSCIDCIASGDKALIQSSYNTEGLANEVLSDPQLGLVDKSQSSKLIDGRLECKFSRWISIDSKAPDAGRVFTLSGEYYLLLANGPVGDDEITKMEHRLGQTKIAPNAVNFQDSKVNDMGDYNDDLIDDKGCNVTKGCFRVPDGCEVSKCKYFVSWSGQADKVDFELVAAMPDDAKWAALGIGRTNMMANSSVVDCIVKNGSVYIQMSYNNDKPDNELLTMPQLGLVDKSQSAKLIDGRLECKFSRWISVDAKEPDAGRVFTLSGNYYLLLANGPVDANGIKQRHHKGQVEVSPYAVSFQENGDNINDKGCGTSKGCFRVPDGCEVSKCKYFVSWSGQTDKVDFELVAAMPDDAKWAALGIGRTNMMANSSVTDCIVKTDGSAYIQMSFNNDKPDNELLSNPQLGLVDKSQSAKLIDGRLECKFSRWISVDAKEPDAGRVFALSGEYYLLLANGPIDANGIKQRHHKGQVEVSPFAVSFQDHGDGEIDDKGCGVSKGCFRVPDGCEVTKCKYFVSWSAQTDKVDFEFVSAMPANAKWAALGIGRGKEMANSSVTDCIVKGDGAYIQMSYNNNDPDNVLLSNPQLGLVDKSQSAKLIDGRLECKFSRWVSVDAKEPDAGRVFTLSGEFYLLLANGPVDSKGIKLIHPKGQVEMSSNTVSFQQNSTSNGTTDEAMPMLIKAHVILMTSAWIVSAAIGAMIGIHFRSVSHERYGGFSMWLWLHRVLMMLAVCATTAGFVVAIIHKGKLSFNGLHHIIGFIVIIIAGINPLVSFCRPRTGANIKTTMRWSHAILGLLVRFGAMVTIFFGVRMPEVGMPDYVQWIVLGFLAFTLLVDFLFLIMKRSMNNRTGYDYALLEQTDETKIRNACCAWFTFVLFVYVLVAFALAGYLIFLILA